MNSFKIYLVASKGTKSEVEFLNILEASLKARIDILQLREKDLSTLEFYNLALKVKVLCEKYNTPLVINDRIDIAMGVNAQGVHIGQKDMPLKRARELLGEDKIIGLTINHKSELDNIQGATYLGAGAVFATPSKQDCTVLGVEGLREIASLSTLPVVAIGGISESNLNMLQGCDIQGVAVVRAIMQANDSYIATLNLRSSFDKTFIGK
ncbi:thiamine phosphate synthase [Campylobacter subantarcticus LMG 24377]|uniref:Thiamine-phosphate synthase n=2 Tax=Campylobacter subantarcticus TaxID=497724 RepID=A0A0A8HAF6_9BACT|nr:thiamine phosphate synthase [Campylobacter subantarcticus]EAJ1261878.1 thiamine phosphate synthase [Campylobacter lari]AJC91118.1 thiamine phosphate synthase [Campylobacter subantarcticus LMG 24374]AJC92896.1 thiamine phosphate synthase [Campylobacter subantarcticus LMG 24377]EAL3939712.1 thiamine phosphate synthase [Campylobacter lari]MPC00212.1 thiamine phosphate synthase [Campylobacter subantarcticus]